MQDISSPIMDQTKYPLHWEHAVLTTGPPEKSGELCLDLKLLAIGKPRERK